jgi:hypothetical protein
LLRYSAKPLRSTNYFQELSVMEMKRREFLARSIAGVGGLLLGPGCISTAGQKSANFDPYERVPLGKTKIMVSRVGLGTGMRGGNRQSNHSRMGKEKFDSLVHASYDRGVRLFDVADLYGTHPYLAGASARCLLPVNRTSCSFAYRPG